MRSAPALFRVNGCGFAVYGARDYDPGTTTYVKTYCFCLLFVPVLAVSAYRVADAGAGWYFIGRVPLSRFARVWNLLLLAALLAGGGLLAWSGYTGSPDYVAKKKLAEADRLAAAGEVLPAARAYHEVALGGSEHNHEAARKFRELLDGPAARAPLADAAEVFRLARTLNLPSVTDKLFERGLALADRHADSDPRGSLAVLEAVAPLAKDDRALTPRRQKLLESVVAREPDDPEPAARLAVIYEAQKRPEKCEALLIRHKDRLGTTEGARVLGQIFARRGKHDEAYALLQPYTQGRLGQLRAAEKALDARLSRLKDQVNNRQALDFPYAQVEAAGEAEQREIVQKYIASKFREDPVLKEAQEAVERASTVVPVALDLGIASLHRAQGIPDPAARKAALENARQVFLSIRGQAGDSPQYRLYLGQVHYWLGDQREGHKLFDELLASAGRNYETLVGVSQVYRGLGETEEARKLAEEAYNKEPDAKKKQQAARLRSLIQRDLDDEIVWLRRSDQADPGTRAALSAARGNKALEEGKDREAAEHLRRAVDLYNRQPPSAAVLNNGALAYLSLYRAAGDRKDLDRGVAMLEKAVAQRGDDSILLLNAAMTMLEAGLRGVVGDAINLNALKMEGDAGLLGYLYRDRAGRDRVRRRVRESEGVARAIRHLERARVLMPRNPEVYTVLAGLYGFTDNREALRSLWQRGKGVELDLSDSPREALDYYAGKKDEKRRRDYKTGLARRVERFRAVDREPRGTTFAVAATRLAEYRLGMERLGMEVNLDEVVALAERAHAAAPSVATLHTLRHALLARAERALAGKQPAYAALLKRARRSLGAEDLVAVALSRPGELAAAVLANEDVRRAFGLVREEALAFPDEPGAWSWAVLRRAHPREAEAVADALRKDDTTLPSRSLACKLAPLSASAALRASWALQVAHQEAEAVAVLKQCAARGVPLPFDP